MPDFKTIAATLFTTGVVGAAVLWSLDERSQIGLALSDELAETRGAHAPAGSFRDTTPNLVLLAIDPSLPATRCEYREARGEEPLPNWWTAMILSNIPAARAALQAGLSDEGDAQFTLRIGDPEFPEWFIFDVAAEAEAGSEVATTAGFYSCLPTAAEFAGGPRGDRFVKRYGLEGVLTLASTRFECGARIPFHFEAKEANGERRWEARGVFEFP
mgnify:CR=1 FL=1